MITVAPEPSLPAAAIVRTVPMGSAFVISLPVPKKSQKSPLKDSPLVDYLVIVSVVLPEPLLYFAVGFSPYGQFCRSIFAVHLFYVS